MENNSIICPTCEVKIKIIETQDGLIWKCFSCNDELPIINLETISD